MIFILSNRKFNRSPNVNLRYYQSPSGFIRKQLRTPPPLYKPRGFCSVVEIRNTCTRYFQEYYLLEAPSIPALYGSACSSVLLSAIIAGSTVLCALILCVYVFSPLQTCLPLYEASAAYCLVLTIASSHYFLI